MRATLLYDFGMHPSSWLFMEEWVRKSIQETKRTIAREVRETSSIISPGDSQLRKFSLTRWSWLISADRTPKSPQWNNHEGRRNLAYDKDSVWHTSKRGEKASSKSTHSWPNQLETEAQLLNKPIAFFQ